MRTCELKFLSEFAIFNQFNSVLLSLTVWSSSGRFEQLVQDLETVKTEEKISIIDKFSNDNERLCHSNWQIQQPRLSQQA